jgi:hypothetical protein
MITAVYLPLLLFFPGFVLSKPTNKIQGILPYLPSCCIYY